jgi:hypothetical protein
MMIRSIRGVGTGSGVVDALLGVIVRFDTVQS